MKIPGINRKNINELDKLVKKSLLESDTGRKKMKKKGKYIRRSTVQENDESLDGQINQCKRKAEELGLVVKDNNIYTDLTISGSTIERPAFLAMKDSIRNGSNCTLIVHDLSHLSESVTKLEAIVSGLMADGVRLISLYSGFDTGRKD